MTNEISNNFQFSFIKGPKFQSVELRNQKQKQTNVGHSVNNEINNGDYKNIGYSIKKGADLAF